MYSVRCSVYSVRCTVYSVQYTVYSVKCTVYSVQCTVYSVLCIVYIVHFTVNSVHGWAAWPDPVWTYMKARNGGNWPLKYMSRVLSKYKWPLIKTENALIVWVEFLWGTYSRQFLVVFIENNCSKLQQWIQIEDLLYVSKVLPIYYIYFPVNIVNFFNTCHPWILLLVMNLYLLNPPISLFDNIISVQVWSAWNSKWSLPPPLLSPQGVRERTLYNRAI